MKAVTFASGVVNTVLGDQTPKMIQRLQMKIDLSCPPKRQCGRQTFSRLMGRIWSGCVRQTVVIHNHNHHTNHNTCYYSRYFSMEKKSVNISKHRNEVADELWRVSHLRSFELQCVILNTLKTIETFRFISLLRVLLTSTCYPLCEVS